MIDFKMIDFKNKIKVKKWLIFLGILSCFMFFDVITAIFYYFLGGDIYNLSTKDTIVFLLIKYLILFIIFLLLYRKYLKEKWFDFIKNFKKYFAIGFKNWFAGFLIMIISNIIINC